MNTYSWKYNIPANAQRVGSELEAIYEEHGKLTPPLIVEDARNDERETHKLIEWDEATAAEKYRLEQARHIMRNIIVVQSTPNLEEPKEEQKIIKFRAFENVETEEQERYFMPMQVAVSREDTRNYMLKQAMMALQSFRQKYGMITDLAAVIDAIDALEQQYTVKQAA
jgi:hypothetical protein